MKYPHAERNIVGEIAIEVKLMNDYSPFFRSTYDATDSKDVKRMLSDLKGKGVNFPKFADDWFY